MKLDVYSPCPGGLNNKIKFCCKDLLPVLETIQGQLDGDQASSALDSIDRQIEQTPDRACLLALRIEALEILGKRNPASNPDVMAAIQQFRDRFPDNPIALAYSAAVRLADSPTLPSNVTFDAAGREIYAKYLREREELCIDAIDQLQTALTSCENNIPFALFAAFGGVGAGLIRFRKYVPALQHMLVHARLAAEDDPGYLANVNQFLRQDAISPFLKIEYRFPYLNDDSPWRDQYNEAARLGNRCLWRDALAAFEKIAKQYGDHPVLSRAIFMASSSLGLDTRAVAALRKIADQATDSLTAFEAEATALELELNQGKYPDDLILHEITVDDANATLERLQSNDRVAFTTVDPASFADRGSPPPKARFVFSDRPIRPAVPAERLEDLPVLKNSAELFGKETDRPARIEWLTSYEDQRKQVNESLREILGDEWREPTVQLIGFRTDTDVPPITSRAFDAASPELRNSADLSDQILNDRMARWLDLPSKFFDGKTPREAAKDAALQRRLQALLILLELRVELNLTAEHAERVRKELGLEPIPLHLKVTTDDVDDLSIWRIARIDVANTDTEQLANLFGFAVRSQIIAGQEVLGEELLRRAEQGERIAITPDRIHVALAGVSRDRAVAIDHLQKAQACAVKLGASPADYLLLEISMQIASHEADLQRVQQLLELLTTRHKDEPGVLEKLRYILHSAGMLSADGRVRLPVPATTTSAVVGAPISEPAPEPAAAPPPAPPSKLWLPGQD